MMCSSKMKLTSFSTVLYYLTRGSVLMPNNQEPVLHTCRFHKEIMGPNAYENACRISRTELGVRWSHF